MPVYNRRRKFRKKRRLVKLMHRRRGRHAAKQLIRAGDLDRLWSPRMSPYYWNLI